MLQASEECRTVVESSALLKDSSLGPGLSMATVAGFDASALNGSERAAHSEHRCMSGSSMSVPHVAGVVA